MTLSGDLPVWAAVLLAVLVVGMLLLQNIGCLLSASAMLDSRRKKPRPTPGFTGPTVPERAEDVEP